MKDLLIAQGLRLLETDGPEAITARSLAKAAGTSTQSVYTHFDGMSGIYDALMRAAFVQFGEHLAQTQHTGDPVADLFALGLNYRLWAVSNPQRYRFMNGITGPRVEPNASHDLLLDSNPSDLPEVNATFEHLLDKVDRAMSAERIRADDPAVVAGQVWSMIHGYVLLEIAGVFGFEGDGVFRILGPLGVNLIVGLGDDQQRALESVLSVAPDPDTLAWTPSQRAAAKRGRLLS